MNLRLSKILTHRFIWLPLLLTALVGGWNAYVVRHNDGQVRGRVTAADGTPVAGATVRMMEQNFTTNSDRGSTTSSADGSFAFTDNRSHNIQLHAEKAGLGRSDQKIVRLYFRAQNVTLDAPLVIAPQANK